MTNANFVLFSALTVTLAGCSTSNMLLDGSLSGSNLVIATEMAENMSTRCVHYSERRDGSDRSGNMKFNSTAAVKFFYVGDQGWFRADVEADGVWDSVFYNPLKQQYVCGQKNWDKFSDAKRILFANVMVNSKTLEVAAPKATPVNVRKDLNVESKLLELKELYNKNLITETQYNERVSKLLASGQ